MKPSNGSKFVYGVGTNDAPYQVHQYACIGGKLKVTWTCPFYRAWKGMLRRCYSARVQIRSPTYIGCSVAPEWLIFSTFRAWMLTQPWDGLVLDKDLLFKGCRVYGPDTCALISKRLNNFMTDHGASRGEWPIGCSWNKKNGKFQSLCHNPFSGKREGLGLFTSPDEAHESWRRRKHELACIYADQQTDPRIASALRARYAKGQPSAQ